MYVSCMYIIYVCLIFDWYLQVRDLIASGKHADLLQYDQLTQEQSAGHAFIGFHEADITFPPTYKFNSGI